MKRFLLHIALLICSAYAVASACEEGTLVVIKGTRCRRYAECHNGSWYLKECKVGQIFYSRTLSCLPVTKVERCEDEPRCSEGRAYSHVGSSNLYYRCINGRISVQVCGAGQVFDHDLQSCRSDQIFQHTSLNRAKREAGEVCKDGTRHRNGDSCKDYIECVNGQEVEKTCPDCMNFDNTTQTCRFVVMTPCVYKTTTPQPTTAQPTTPQPTDPPTTEHPPSPQPTDSPTTQQPPSPQPTDSPTTEQPPSPQPTDSPTTEQPPSPQPTDSPTTQQPPSPQPTDSPTTEQPPSPQPTDSPTTEQPPSPRPTHSPTSQPTDSPTTEQPSTPDAETTTLPPSSTITPCKEGDKVGLVDPECKAYKECKKGVWVNDACGWARKFDAIKKECEYTMWNTITCAQ